MNRMWSRLLTCFAQRSAGRVSQASLGPKLVGSYMENFDKEDVQAKDSFDNRKKVKNTLTLKVWKFMRTSGIQIILDKPPCLIVTNLLSLSLLPTHTSLNCWKYLVLVLHRPQKHSHENMSRNHSPESHLCCVISFLFADPELTELLKLECCCGWDVGESLSQPPKFYAGTSFTKNLLVTTEV